MTFGQLIERVCRSLGHGDEETRRRAQERARLLYGQHEGTDIETGAIFTDEEAQAIVIYLLRCCRGMRMKAR